MLLGDELAGLFLHALDARDLKRAGRDRGSTEADFAAGSPEELTKQGGLDFRRTAYVAARAVLARLARLSRQGGRKRPQQKRST
ncbi:hypothetical protein [Bradyrhizobium sp. SZCCHNS2002]|uniref:hypothetical protein n=1 Tax=Bradyrhizobium sp. SZCCHNS2002 TaxID=3057302 RepID=UPI0029167235|nr:hypothetical protein [Bradyrhizobium sp. SZCCHNS2002]